MLRERLDDEDGVALIYVLFATMVISGLVVIFMSRVLFETRSTADARDFEAAIHAAEAGAESLLGAINTEGKEFVNKIITDGPGGDHTYAVDLTQSDEEIRAEEEAWAIGLADADPSGLVDTDEGQAYGIRPQNSAGTEAEDIVFGVGFIPSASAPDRHVRVVKMRIARRFFSPDHALLSGGDLSFGGNAEILAPGCSTSTPEDCDANVHSNGNVNVTGSSHEVQGDFTASGTMSGTPNTTGSSSAAGEETVPVPELTARDFYNRDVTYNVDPATGLTAEWFDLCSDGTVHEPGATPCTGTQVWPDPADPASTNFRGWEYKPSRNAWESRKVESGIFYVHGADASVNGSAGVGPRAATIIVEGDPASPSDSGSLEMAGNPNLVSALPDVLFIVDRDLKMKGTSGGGQEEESACDPNPSPCDTQHYAGFIYVVEQIDISGTVELAGAMINQDLEDLHGLVKRNTAGLNGTMVLDYDEDLELDLTGRVTIEYWNEL